MPRTTVNIDAPLLRDLKRLQKREGKPLGRLISELLADALVRRQRASAPRTPFRWTSQPMHARIDLTDKEALYAVLDRDAGRRPRP